MTASEHSLAKHWLEEGSARPSALCTARQCGRRAAVLLGHVAGCCTPALAEAPTFVTLPWVSPKIGAAAWVWRCWLPFSSQMSPLQHRWVGDGILASPRAQQSLRKFNSVGSFSALERWSQWGKFFFLFFFFFLNIILFYSLRLLWIYWDLHQLLELYFKEVIVYLRFRCTDVPYEFHSTAYVRLHRNKRAGFLFVDNW